MSEEIKTITIKSKPFLPKGVENLEEKDKEIERLNNIINKTIASIDDLRERLNYYGEDDFKVDMSMLTFLIDLLKDSDKE